MNRRACIAVLALLGAACGHSDPRHGAAAAPARACLPGWPAVAHHAGGEIISLPDSALPIACAVESGYATSESTLAVSGDGHLVYSPAQNENSLARSGDAGASWQLTFPAVAQPTSFWNTVDPYLIADRSTGRLFWVHATGPVRNENALPQDLGFYLAAAAGFQVYTSVDDGYSWTTADYQTAPTGDWEQLFLGPAPADAAQPVGYPNVIYMCANSPVEVAGPGRICYKSLDGGATFQIGGFVTPSATTPQDICQPLQFRNGVVDRAGTIYIPATCQLSDYIAQSSDEGASWSWSKFANAPTSSGILPGEDFQLAVDDGDTLYALWTDPADGQLRLEMSRDLAKTWSTPMPVSAPGLKTAHRATFAAGAAGQLAIAYYGSDDPAAESLTAYITQTQNALDDAPVFFSAPLNDPAAPIFVDSGLTGGRPRADFIGGGWDAAGTQYWAGMVKQLGPDTVDEDSDQYTTGLVGHLEFPATAPLRLP